MIITAPTGLYKSVIPQSPDQSGDVTFTISTTDPPRRELLFNKIPPGVERRLRQPFIHSDEVRRSVIGDLLNTVSKSDKSLAGLGNKQFEVGDILEFEEEITEDELQPTLVVDKTEIRHDTNLLDLPLLGLDESEQAQVTRSAEVEFDKLGNELNNLKQSRRNTESQLLDVQKQINETRKAISALEIIDDPDIVEIKEGLEESLDELQDQRSNLIATGNELAELTSEKLDEVRSVAQLVR